MRFSIQELERYVKASILAERQRRTLEMFIERHKATDFRVELVAETTVAKRIMQAKALFNEARRRGLITASPFEAVRSGSQVNKERHYFVTVADTNALIDACNNPSQHLIIALARWGGLRVPSELAGVQNHSDTSAENGFWCFTDIEDELQNFTQEHAVNVLQGGEVELGDIDLTEYSSILCNKFQFVTGKEITPKWAVRDSNL